MRSRWLAPAAFLSVLSVFAAPLRAETFLLQQGGQIEGELVNPNEIPRQTYVIKTASGAKITLDRAQVKQVVRRRPVEEEYEKLCPRYADTVDGQWKLAEWCRERGLAPQRRTHLERIIELEANHVQARRALGYSQINGKWTTQKEAMEEQGLEWYKGRYRTRQEIDLLEERQKLDSAEKEWMQKLDRWQAWLRGDKARMAKECIDDIKDPAAVKGLVQAMKGNSNPHVRVLFVSALARIGSQDAQKALAFFAIEDPIEEVRLSCLDRLKEKKAAAAVDYFVGYLRHKDNRYVNRAAVALGQMGDASAVAPLIDALVTTHKYKLRSPPPGQTTTSFGTGPGGGPGGIGMSQGGGGPKVVAEHVQNRCVLDALAELTSVNYGYDIKAWKSWYATQRQRAALDARRGT